MRMKLLTTSPIVPQMLNFGVSPMCFSFFRIYPLLVALISIAGTMSYRPDSVCCAPLYISYNINMKLISSTEARRDISAIINRVKYHGDVFAIGRRNAIDALLIQFPQAYSDKVNDVTNVNAHSKSFDFLAKEPDLYDVSDLMSLSRLQKRTV